MERAVYEKIQEYFFAHKEEIQKDLFSLIAIPSVKGEVVSGAPFGIECRRALDAAVALFRREGFSAECYAEGRYGLATFGEGEGDVGIFTHTDVVGVGDDWEFTSPFAPVAIGDGLIGRGVEDNKCAVIFALYFLKAVRDLRIPLKHRMVVFLGAEEESGMEDIEAFVKEQPMPRVSFVPDNGYPICVGEKSILRLWVWANTPLAAVSSLEGGVAFNVVLDRFTAKFKNGKAVEKALLRQIAGKSGFSVTMEGESAVLSVHGKTAHASIPQCATNALHLGCDLLSSCDALPEGDRAQFSAVAHFLADCYGGNLGIGIEDPYFGKLTAANGMVALQNGCLGFSLDMRYGAEQDDEEILARLAAACGAKGFSLGAPLYDKGALVDPKSDLVASLLSVYREITGKTEAEPYLSGGGTYARKLRNAFSIGVSTRPRPSELHLPAGHGGAHQSDEALSFLGFLEGSALNAAFVLEGDRLV